MDDHSKTIIHIDIDCFYAQVEMVKQPSLKDVPLGIQQKSIVVTSNYVAREYGIKKCMSIAEARKLCPNLVLVNGEDLYDYRHVSNKVSDLLQTYSQLVERLGLDENFVDVTELVRKRIANTNSVGCIFGNKSDFMCDCGCMERICVGSQIAQEMRERIFQELGLTTCAGIAHNKLLAKIVGTTNKPNNQTLLFPNSSVELMLSLEDVRNIPWIGHVSSNLLNDMGINKVKELQDCDFKKLENAFDKARATMLVNLSLGIDNTPVKKSGKPQSIGLEDACRALTTETGVEEKLKELLARLLILVNEDGRIPKVMKLTIRKLDQSHALGGVRETRQCNINIPLNNSEKLISVGMGLFRKVIDKGKMFKITLIGVAFSKFIDKPDAKNTLNHFLLLSKGNKASPTESIEAEEESSLPPAGKRSKLSESCTSTIKSSILEAPPGVDQDVFRELPPELQRELLDDFNAKKAREDKQKSGQKRKINNTIYNYMIRQPKT